MANWADGGGSTRMLWTGQMGLITRRSWVQIPPPPLRETSSTAESPRCRGLSCCFSVLPGVNHRFIGTFFRDLLNPCVCSICTLCAARVARTLHLCDRGSDRPGHAWGSRIHALCSCPTQPL